MRGRGKARKWFRGGAGGLLQGTGVHDGSLGIFQFGSKPGKLLLRRIALQDQPAHLQTPG